MSRYVWYYSSCCCFTGLCWILAKFATPQPVGLLTTDWCSIELVVGYSHDLSVYGRSNLPRTSCYHTVLHWYGSDGNHAKLDIHKITRKSVKDVSMYILHVNQSPTIYVVYVLSTSRSKINVGRRKVWQNQLFFSITWERNLTSGLQMKSYRYWILCKFEEESMTIGHQFAKFTNVFSRQHFLLYGMAMYSCVHYCISRIIGESNI